MRTYKIKTIWGDGFVEVNENKIVTKSTTRLFEQFIDKPWELMRDYIFRWGGSIKRVDGEHNVMDK